MKWLVVALGEALAPLFIGKVGGLVGDKHVLVMYK
jgi:hypothetical protein